MKFLSNLLVAIILFTLTSHTIAITIKKKQIDIESFNRIESGLLEELKDENRQRPKAYIYNTNRNESNEFIRSMINHQARKPSDLYNQQLNEFDIN